jgi:hypothetical protein
MPRLLRLSSTGGACLCITVMLFRSMAKKPSLPPSVPAEPVVKRRRGRPPRPGGPKPQVEVQRAYRARLAAAGKMVRLVDAVALAHPAAMPGFDPATQLICDRETFEDMCTRLHNALVELEVRVEDVKRLEARNDHLEGELRRSEQHHTIALKDVIVLKQQLAKRREKLRG